MEITGKIIQILPAMEGVGQNGNPWKVQPYVLETQGDHPKKVHFEIFGEDRINQNPCDVDDVVDVHFDIESREYNGRWYTSVRAWRVNPHVDTPAAQPVAKPAPKQEPTVEGAEEASSDLPF